MIKFIQSHYKILLVCIVIVCIGGIFYYRSVKAKEVKPDSAQVKRGNLSQSLQLSGSIKAEKTATLRFQAGGKLVKLAVKEGDIVKKGQFIGSIDQRQLKKTLGKTLNDFLKKRWDLDQQRDTYDDTISNDTIKRIVEKAQFDVNSSVLDVEIDNISIELANIFSPIDGVITSTNNLQVGTNVTAATDIVDIIGPDSLYFELTADQTEVTTIQEGLKGNLILDAFLDSPLSGEVSHIGFTPKEGESNTVYVVKFNFTNSSDATNKYRVGMTGDVEFITKEKKNVLFLPFKYITEDNGKKYAQIMEKNKLVKKEVQTGLENDINVEITSGLQEGDTVYD